VELRWNPADPATVAFRKSALVCDHPVDAAVCPEAARYPLGTHLCRADLQRRPGYPVSLTTGQPIVSEATFAGVLRGAAEHDCRHFLRYGVAKILVS
jgi:hypothetical protein